MATTTKNLLPYAHEAVMAATAAEDGKTKEYKIDTVAGLTLVVTPGVRRPTTVDTRLLKGVERSFAERRSEGATALS